MNATKQHQPKTNSEPIPNSLNNNGKQYANDKDVVHEVEKCMARIVGATNVKDGSLDHFHIRHAITAALEQIKHNTTIKLMGK